MTIVESEATLLDESASVLDPAQRWFNTGRSTDNDARVAGAQAAAAALAGRSAALVIVFSDGSVDLEAMLDGVKSQIGGSPLIGCSGVAEIDSNGVAQGAVVVSALGGEGFEISVSAAKDVSAGQRAAGEKVAECALSLTREHKLLLLLGDGLAGDQHEVMRGAYSVVGATIPLAGGAAADNYEYVRAHQFISDADGLRLLSDAVVSAAIGSDGPIGIGLAHGWRKKGEPMVVTKSDGSRIHTIDGEPAIDVFLRRTGAPESLTDDPQAFTRFAVNHPLGMSRRSGEDIRAVHAADVTTGSITCLADVPHGGLLWMMETDRAGLLSSVDTSYSQAIESLDGATPLGFLAFDCAVRYLSLGDDGRDEEMERFRSVAKGAPFAGFYTFGEFARTRGSRGMHHMTLVIVAFG